MADFATDAQLSEYFQSLSMSKIWLKYRLFCPSCSVAA